jgi:hypothetical protein
MENETATKTASAQELDLLRIITGRGGDFLKQLYTTGRTTRSSYYNTVEYSKIVKKLITERIKVDIYYSHGWSGDNLVSTPLRDLWNWQEFRKTPYESGKHGFTNVPYETQPTRTIIVPSWIGMAIAGQTFCVQKTKKYPFGFVGPSSEFAQMALTYVALNTINNHDPINQLIKQNKGRSYKQQIDEGKKIGYGKMTFRGMSIETVEFFDVLGILQPIPSSRWATFKKGAYNAFMGDVGDSWKHTILSSIRVPVKTKTRARKDTIQKWGYRTGGGISVGIDMFVVHQSSIDKIYKVLFTAFMNRVDTGSTSVLKKLLGEKEGILEGHLDAVAVKGSIWWPGYYEIDWQGRGSVAPITQNIDRQLKSMTTTNRVFNPDIHSSVQNQKARFYGTLDDYLHRPPKQGLGDHWYDCRFPQNPDFEKYGWQGLLAISVHKNILDIRNEIISYRKKKENAARQYIWIAYGTPAWIGTNLSFKSYQYLQQRKRWSKSGNPITDPEKKEFFELWPDRFLLFASDPKVPDLAWDFKLPWHEYADYRPVYQWNLWSHYPHNNPNNFIDLINPDYPGLHFVYGTHGAPTSPPRTPARNANPRFNDICVYEPSGSFKTGGEWTGPYMWIFGHYYSVAIQVRIMPVCQNDQTYKRMKQNYLDWNSYMSSMRYKRGQEDAKRRLKQSSWSENSNYEDISQRLDLKVGICCIDNFIHDQKKLSDLMNPLLDFIIDRKTGYIIPKRIFSNVGRREVEQRLNNYNPKYTT